MKQEMYPYTTSIGGLVKTIRHLRKSFPRQVTAETLKKLGFAPNNESYIINVLKFLGLLDGDGNKVEEQAKALMNHRQEDFQVAFSSLVEEAYKSLFELHGEAAWTLSRADLIQYFRTSSHSTELVGGKQASTFLCLAGIAGCGDVPATGIDASSVTRKPNKVPRAKRTIAAHQASADSKPALGATGIPPASPVGLTVRIEVNLPADGNQETYDKIFTSIRKHLIDGNAN